MTARTATVKKTTADDQPFDFNLDTVEAEVELRPFRVHFAGKRWEFTHMQALNAWDALAAAEGGDVRVVAESMKLALGDQWEEFRKLPLPQHKVMPLFQAWQKHSGVESGESAASES
ncbi:hypothetical protein ACFQ6Q_00840 [Streptomyces sp. NPDC056437]|uniref:hypothetical protein n=1 Tax=Streptomyces sp. NPDC056437 TaxID=3345816 RepID=UPI00367DC69C